MNFFFCGGLCTIFLAFVSPLSLRLLRFMVVSISPNCSPSELFFLAFFLGFLLGDEVGCGSDLLLLFLLLVCPWAFLLLLLLLSWL